MEETSSVRLRWVTAILAAVCLVAGPLAATVVRAFSPSPWRRARCCSRATFAGRARS